MNKITRLDGSEVIEVNRVDFMNRPIGKVRKTDEGYLQGDAAIAKVGILTYAKTDGGYVNELVTDETLFEIDSMKSLQMKPITNAHPKETVLDSKTVKRRKVGFTGETVKQDEDFLTSSVLITDDDAIQSVTGGRQELSPGYTCKLLLQPGVFQGIKYDAIQLERRYNHVALCDKARGGKDLRLNLDNVERCDGFEIEKFDAVLTTTKREQLKDSDFCFVVGEGKNKVRKFPAHDAAHVRNALARLPQSNLTDSQKASVKTCLIGKAEKFGVKVSKDSIDFNKDDYNLNKQEFYTINRKGQSMDLPTIRVDGIEYPASQEVINRLNKLATDVQTQTQRADDAEAKVTTVTAEKDTLQGKLDTATEEITTLKADAGDVKKVNEAVTARIKLLDAAAAVIKEDEEVKKLDTMTDKDIKIAVIKTRTPDVNLDDQSDDYINARFDAIIEATDFDPDAINRQRRDSVSKHEPSGDKIEKAKTDSEEKMKKNYETLGQGVKE
jgi:hypothetical protein